ncbi:hypothetical protein RJT34_27420 [Clitoria ternatea]|uniref:Uncharacterized protein n=1 Tax=Clitoria ternatea TaxID=43366 RepID=A0AAN9F9X9_CLITE
MVEDQPILRDCSITTISSMNSLAKALEDEYGGWDWTTVNELNVFALSGYDMGNAPPQRCSPPFCIANSTRGNSTYEPYFAVHHILLSHSSAVRLYRRKYRDYGTLAAWRLSHLHEGKRKSKNSILRKS